MKGRDANIPSFFKRRAALWLSILLPLLASDLIATSVLSWLAEWATVPGVIKTTLWHRGPPFGFVHTRPLRANLYTSDGEAHVIAEYSQEWQSRHLDTLGVADLPDMRYMGEYAAFYYDRSSGVLVPWCRTRSFKISVELRDDVLSEQQELAANAMAYRAWLAESRIHAGWRAAANNGARGLPAESSEWHVVGILHDVLMVFCIILAIGLVPAAREQRKLARQSAATRCPQCGYPRASLPSATCPECGFTVRKDSEDSKV